MKDDQEFNLTIDNSEPWWNLDVSEETKEQFRKAIIQYCVHSNLNAYQLKESCRQVKEMLQEMGAINPEWRSVTYYNFNEKYLAHKAFYLELRYVLRKKDQLNAQINALKYTTPNQPPKIKEDIHTAPIKISELKLEDTTSAEPIYDTDDQHSDTESDSST